MRQRVARTLLAGAALALARGASAQQAADPLPDAGVLSDAAPAGEARGHPLLKVNGLVQDVQSRPSAAFGTPEGSTTNYLLNIDARGELRAKHPLRFNYSLRLAVSDAAASGKGARLYAREGYLTWAPDDRVTITLGRINYRNGVAYAYNPTDLFRSRSSVDEISLDPLVRRESRLGTFMASGLLLFDKGAVTAIFAPKLSDPRALSYTRPQGLGLDLHRTNTRTRVLVKASYTVDKNVSPEILLLDDGGQLSAGMNLSVGIGETVVAYVEARGGTGDNLLARSHAFAVQTGVLPRVPDVLPGARSQTFYDLATGVSYTPVAKLNIVIEYDRSGGAPAASRWAELATIAARGGLAQAEFRLLNYFAANEEEPRTRDGVFLRIGADSVFTEHLGCSVLASVSPQDHSGFAQATAVLDVGAGWTISMVSAATFGGARTVYGGSTLERSVSLGFARTF